MKNDGRKKWTTTDSQYLVNDRWIKLRADRCITPDGAVLDPFYILEYNDWINCLVLSDDNEVTMLQHYRHGIKEYVLEIVGGGVEDGELPEDAARRELMEELGLVGATIHQIGVCYPNPANQSNTQYCYIALGGEFTGKQNLEPGEDFQIVKIPLAELIKKIEDQDTMFQSLHLTNIFLALNFLKKRELLAVDSVK